MIGTALMRKGEPMRLIDADALKARYIVTTTTTNSLCHLYVSIEDINNAPTIEPPHGLLLPNVPMPAHGCNKCIFREGNLCRFLPASVPVVECAKRNERHKECPLVEV